MKSSIKSLVIPMVLAGMLVSTNALAAKRMVEVDDGSPEIIYENMISTNVYPWVVGFFNLGYQRALTNSLSIRPRASYWAFSANDGDWALYPVGIDLFFHPMGKGLAGWYIGPRYDAWILSVNDQNSSASGTGIVHLIGAIFGYNWIFEGGFSFGFGLGAQTVLGMTISTNEGTDTFEFPYKGFLPSMNLEIGYVF